MEIRWLAAILPALFCQYTAAQESLGIWISRDDYRFETFIKEVFDFVENTTSHSINIISYNGHGSEVAINRLCNDDYFFDRPEYSAVVLERFETTQRNSFSETPTILSESQKYYCENTNIYQMDIARVSHVFAGKKQRNPTSLETILEPIYSFGDKEYTHQFEIEEIMVVDKIGVDSLSRLAKETCHEDCNLPYESYEHIYEAVEEIESNSRKKYWDDLHRIPHYTPEISNARKFDPDEIFWMTENQAAQADMILFSGAGVNGEEYTSIISILMTEELAELWRMSSQEKPCPDNCTDSGACPQTSPLDLVFASCCDDEDACPQKPYNETLWNPIKITN